MSVLQPTDTTNPIQVVVGIVIHARMVLITRRHDDGRHLAGYWEFPGGKVDSGETLEAALHRELAEELGIQVKVRTALPVVHHTYPRTTVALHPYICDLTGGDPKPLASQELRWVSASELENYQFPPANSSWLKRVLDLLAIHEATPRASRN